MTPPRAILGIRSAPERERIGSTLVSLGYEVTLSESVEQLLEQSPARRARVLIADSAFVAAANGNLLAVWRERMPGVPMLVLPDAPDGRAAGRAGDAHAHPVGISQRMLAELEPVIGALRRETVFVELASLDPFAGRSKPIRVLADQARDALASPSPILIEGETGTGKGVLAAWLHRNGPRAKEAFVDLNCAGFSHALMDSELFGHEKGAFTGAVTRKPGLV